MDIDRMLSWCRWFEGGGRWCDGAVGSQVDVLNLSLHLLNLLSSMMQGKLCLVSESECGWGGIGSFYDFSYLPLTLVGRRLLQEVRAAQVLSLSKGIISFYLFLDSNQSSKAESQTSVFLSSDSLSQQMERWVGFLIGKGGCKNM